MRQRKLFAAAIVVIGAWVLPLTAARADAVLYDSAGFIQGKQSFVESFDITAPGTLTITLSNIPWLDTITDLNCFLTSSGGLIGKSMGVGSESFNVGSGMVYAHWFGDADGAYGLGVYGVKIMFQPNGATTVALPRSLVLLLSGLGVLLGWQRRKPTVPACPSADEALTI
jgi:hypothetical protein